MIQTGTYVRESDGACLMYHSPTTWNDPVYAVNHRPRGEDFRAGSHMSWRIVPEEEVQDLARAGYGQLWPGEYVIVEEVPA